VEYTRGNARVSHSKQCYNYNITCCLQIVSERRSAMFTPAGSSRNLADDRQPVTHKPPFLPPSKTPGGWTSPPRQKPPSKPSPKASCLPCVGGKDSGGADAGGEAVSFTDHPNRISDQSALMPSSELVLGAWQTSSMAKNRGQPDENLQRGSSKQHVEQPCSKGSLRFQQSNQDNRVAGGEHQSGMPSSERVLGAWQTSSLPNNRGQTGENLQHGSSKMDCFSKNSAPFPFQQSNQDNRVTETEHQRGIRPVSSQQGPQGSKQCLPQSYVPTQGNALEHSSNQMTARFGSSMPSHHDPSSNFNNVRSFSPVIGAKAAETPHIQRCPDATSQSALRRITEDDRDGKSLPSAPDNEDRFGSSLIQTSMAIPAQLGQHPDSPKSATRVQEVTEMHTPPLRAAGSDACRCDQSTPMPGHEAEAEYSFTSQGATKDEFSGLASLARKSEH